jgi:superfamily I DNA/RNA helicase
MRGFKPEEILLISFTATAAAEMRDRIIKYAEEFGVELDAEKLRIYTFNAFGDEILKTKFEEFGFPAPPHVIDNIDASRIISEILCDHDVINGLDYRHFDMETKYVKGALPMTKQIFSIMKKNMLTEDDVREIWRKVSGNVSLTAVEEVAKLYDEYDERLRSEGLIEFADQETMIFELFHRDPFYLETLGFKHIIVDEFQDSNEREIQIIRLLRDTPQFESLMVVGDDSQAIFSFKDTTPDYIINFEDAMREEVDTINLLNNYRSQANIIEFANEINNLNRHKVAKSLIATRPAGKPVVVRGVLNDEQKFAYVLEKIQEKLEEGYNPEDIAILTRQKKDIEKYADILAKANIPAQIGCGINYLQNCRVIAAISYFNVMEDENNTVDILNFLNAKIHGGIMDLPAEEIEEMADDLKVQIETLGALSDKEQKEEIMSILRDIDSNCDEIYLDFIDKLERKPTIFEMKRYIQSFSKYGENECFRRSAAYPGVKLMTAHSSKGLEWPVVINDIDDYEKHLKPGVENEDSEEARRLFFVSSTRARDELYVVANYVASGTKKTRVYNRFLKEAYDLTGQVFSASSIEEQIDMLAKEKKKKAEAKKKSA